LHRNNGAYHQEQIQQAQPHFFPRFAQTILQPSIISALPVTSKCIPRQRKPGHWFIRSAFSSSHAALDLGDV